MDARGIAEFLILDGRFPRSLRFCFNKLVSNMESLAREYGDVTPVHDLVRNSAARLHSTTTDQIIEFGLHETIVSIIAETQAIADGIARDYRFTA
jgi:uncharacterized alpha-E superfamily protein